MTLEINKGQFTNSNDVASLIKKVKNTNTAYDLRLSGDGSLNQGCIDKFDKISSKKLTQEEEKKRNQIYNKIANICLKHDISIELAKNERLLERISGLSTKALLNATDSQIDFYVSILNENLGFGDGLGFGKKDEGDINKLIKNINQKFGLEKTGGSKFGQILHKIGSGIKNIFDAKTLDKYSDSDEISNYYKTTYLDGIENLSVSEKEAKYKELLTKFYYDFDDCKDISKKMSMVKAIENLAAKDRGVIVEVMERTFGGNADALKKFGKVLNQNFESIVTSKDAFGQRVTKKDATFISHTSFKNMSEEDVENAIVTLKNNAEEFYAKAKALEEKRANGEELTAEELEFLENVPLFEEIVYVAGYAGATTGTFCNANISSETARLGMLSQINEDSQELGIQEQVFKTVQEFAHERPEVINNQPEVFKEFMNKATDNKYEEIITGKSLSKNSVGAKTETSKSQAKPLKTIPLTEIKSKGKEDVLEQQVDNLEKTQHASGDVKVQTPKTNTVSSEAKKDISESETEVTTSNKEEKICVSKPDVVEVAHGSTNEFQEYIKDNGAFNTVVEVYSNLGDITNKGVLTCAQRLYTMFNADRQKEILYNVKSCEGFSALLACTSDNVILGLDTDFNSYYTNKKVQKAQEEAKKRANHSLAKSVV